MAPSEDLPLPKQFVLYVPSGIASGLSLCEILELTLCETLGGVTSYPAKGTFKMDDGSRMAENIQVLECFCESGDWSKQRPFLMALAAVVGGMLHQQAIAVAIDGRMQMVLPAKLPVTTVFPNTSETDSVRWLTALVQRELGGESAC